MTEGPRAPIPVSETGFPGMNPEESRRVFTQSQEFISAGDVDGLAAVLTSAMVESAVEEVSSLRPEGSESTPIVSTKPSSA